MSPTRDQVAAYLSEYPDPVCEIATALRKLILTTLSAPSDLRKPGLAPLLKAASAHCRGRACRRKA